MISDAEGNASTLLNRAGIVELPLLSTLLAIYQKSREPSLWEVMNSFLINIGKFGSFKNPFAKIVLSALNVKSFGITSLRSLIEAAPSLVFVVRFPPRFLH